MFIGPCIIAIVDEWKTNMMSLAILFHLLCATDIQPLSEKWPRDATSTQTLNSPGRNWYTAVIW